MKNLHYYLCKVAIFKIFRIFVSRSTSFEFSSTKLCYNVTALPVVSNVHAKKLSLTTYSGEGEYFGGYEGESLYSWYRESDDGKIVLTSGADCKTYEVTDADYGCRLLFG